MELVGQPTIPASQELSLEDTFEAFRQITNQPCQEIIDATVANTEAVARLEGQIGHLVAEFNKIEEEELQSQEMAKGQYMIDDDCPNDPHHEHVQATTTLVSEERANNHEEEEEEMEEQMEPSPILNWSNDKDVSTEAHSFVTIPLETFHSPQVSSYQCLEEPSYVEIFLKNFYIRWWNILPEGYHILKKKGWKGLVGHPYERGRCGIFPFLFFALHFLFIFFLLFLFSVILFLFVSVSNSN
jgi:hypothetical protein